MATDSDEETYIFAERVTKVTMGPTGVRICLV